MSMYKMTNSWLKKFLEDNQKAVDTFKDNLNNK